MNNRVDNPTIVSLFTNIPSNLAPENVSKINGAR